MEKLNWGILSTAKIGIEKVIPAMQKSSNGNVLAIASRSLDNAKSMADALNIERAYCSDEQLLADDEIHAIYNPLAQSPSCSVDNQMYRSRQACAV